MRLGFTHVYTGDGKGKTTAALGLAVRAAGAGQRIAVVYFDKGGSDYSERRTLTERFPGVIDFWATGLDRRDPETGRFRFGVTSEDRAETQKGLAIARRLLDGADYGLIILDEMITVLSLAMCTEKEVLRLIRARHGGTELVLTGRGLTEAVGQAADLITEMKAVRHYYGRGVPARPGIEY